MRRGPFLFGTLLLCHVLAAESLAPAWPEFVRQARDALAREDYPAAAEFAQRAVSQAESGQRSGPKADLDFASALSILGAARLSLGDSAEATPLIERALDIRRKLLPAPNYDLATSICNDASVLLLSAEFSRARALAAEAAAMFESLHSTDNIDYGVTLNNLAVAIAELGEYAPAVAMYDRAHAALSTVLPPAAPRIVQLLVNQGIAVQRSGDLVRASGIVEGALDLARQAAPPNPPLLANALNALGDLRLLQGRTKDAEMLLTEALRLASAFDPPMPLRRGLIEANLARANHRNGHIGAAEEHFQSALATLRKVQSNAPTEYASQLNNYGLLLVQLRRFTPAADAFSEAQSIFEAKLGASHPSSVAVTVNLAGVAERRHQAARAAELYQRAVDLDTEHFGRNHYRVGLDLNSLGAFEARHKHLPEAARFLRESYGILRTAYGPDHPEVALIAANLGRTLWMMKLYDEAEGLFAESIRIQELRFGADYAQLIPLYEEYAQLLHANQHFAASESAKLSAMRIRVRQALGKTSAAG